MSPAATTKGSAHGHVRFLPVTYDSSDSQSALKLILSLFPQWGSDDSNVDFVRFTDGITNTLLKAVNRRPGLSKADIDRDAVLLRAYGNGTAVIIDREREAANHELLMKHGLAPELLARFANGMLYRFVPGTVAQPKDLSDPALLAAVARLLAQWHATVPCLPDSAIKGEEPAEDGNPDSPDSRRKAMITKAAAGKPIPNLWSTMQKWILALPTDTEQQRERQALLQRELEEMVEKLSQRPGLGKDGLVFAHCDLLSANIIMHREPGRELSVSFIDYEYATPSPAAFDISNHFAEWAGYDCDYSAVPTRPQRQAFIREYIASYAKLSCEEMNLDEETEKLMNEVDVFRGVPGFYWGIWALIQATISHIDFDYASYAESRLGEYWAYKAEVDGSRAAAGKEMPLREKTWSRNE
ncbi:kinase-like protein [Trichoderma citrinoviride]|uniref:ethanolamine kinase n=1 Tax=Trichoderma citrinoviride TaxID=58853 RepID=A0A2T4B496_9HYPO|nr:kinase-like protein [Trichoderma citrinoviride]PTB64135.1 kinase-like protein [Trichoderma citrinoviride]